MKTNFEILKDQFKKETNLDWKDNVAVYIAYYQAKMIEQFANGYYAVNKISTTPR